MSRRNIYQGPESCYAEKEGMYALGDGIDLRSAPAILYFLLRDLRRGYTYDHSCRVIKMTPRLFVRRARYLIPLCKKHGKGRFVCERVEKMVEYVIKRKKLPLKPRPGFHYKIIRKAKEAVKKAKKVLLAAPVIVRRRAKKLARLRV